MAKKGLIVRRHPAIERGYDRGSKGIKVAGKELYDITSSDFEWYIETDNYKMLKEEELDKYIQCIENNMEEDRVLVVSSHQVVKNRLEKLGIKTLAVYPNKELFKKFSTEMEKRKNRNQNEIDYVNRHWFPFINEIAKDTANTAHIEVFNPKLTLVELLEEYMR